MAKKIKKEETDQTFIDKIFQIVEKDRFTMITAAIYLLIIGVARSYTESKWFGFRNFSLNLIAQHTLFNLPVILLVVLGVAFVSQIRPKKIFNVIFFGFSMDLLPPFIDRFIFGLGVEDGALYEYWTTADFVEVSRRFFTLQWGSISEISTPGQLLMLSGMVVMVGLYVILKKRSVLKGFFASAAVAFVIFFVANLFLYVEYVIVTQYYGPPQYLGHVTILSTFQQPLIPHYYNFVIDAWPGYGNFYIPFAVEQQRSYGIICFFLITSIVATLATARLFYRELFDHLIRKIDHRMFFISAAAVIGIASVASIDPTYGSGYALDFLYIPHLSYIFVIVFAIFCAWMYVDMSRELEYSTGKKKWHIEDVVTRYQYKEIGKAFGIMAVFFSLLLGAISFSIVSWIPFIFIMLFIIIGRKIYNKEEIKSKGKTDFRRTMKNSYPGLVLLAFLFGIFSPSAWVIMAPTIAPSQYQGTLLVDTTRMQDVSIDRIPGLSASMVVTGIIIIIFSYYYYDNKYLIDGTDDGNIERSSKEKKKKSGQNRWKKQ